MEGVTNMDYHRLMLENQTIFTKLVYGHLLPSNLSLGQPKVLEYISEHDGCAQKDIATNCLIEPASVSSMLSTMEKEGLIHRKANSDNRRSSLVSLTELGLEKAGYVKKTFEEVEKKALKDFTAEEIQQLLDLLMKVNKNLKE